MKIKVDISAETIVTLAHKELNSLEKEAMSILWMDTSNEILNKVNLMLIKITDLRRKLNSLELEGK
ncbi:hypothetical protein [Enterococcus gallinarum]|uniref:hypothetical protein n=1 Tax=Enterococcus gallinarum TaxID=1353 RepID=UPI00243361BF|nr:hypothetical protein [Enterococcus gallinarum]